MKLIINNLIIICLIDSSIIYIVHLVVYRVSVFGHGCRIRTVSVSVRQCPSDTPVIYCIKRLNKIVKSQ